MDDDHEQQPTLPAPTPAPLPLIPLRPTLFERQEAARASLPGRKRAQWREKPPTQKQLHFLREHGHRRPVANRGEASDLISAAFEQEKRTPGYLAVLWELTAYPGRQMVGPPPWCVFDMSKTEVRGIADLIQSKDA